MNLAFFGACQNERTMKKSIFVIISILSLSSGGCSKKAPHDEDIKTIVVSAQDINNEILLSNYVESIEEINLETTDQSIIGGIEKVILYEDALFIFDKKGKSILKFFKNGKLISKLAAVGKGPGEYFQPFDFDIHQGSIYLLDYTRKRLLIYDLDFNYKNYFQLNNYYTNVAVLENQILLYTSIYNTENSYNLTAVNETGEIIYELFPYKDKEVAAEQTFDWTSGGGFCFAKQDDKTVFFSKTFNDTIYQISDRVAPFLSFDFASSHSFSYADINTTNIFDPDRSYVFKYNFFSSENLLLYAALKGGKPFFIFQDLNTEKISIGKVKNDLNQLPFFPEWSSKDCLIAFLSMEDYRAIKKEELNNNEEYDNDLLLLFHLK